MLLNRYIDFKESQQTPIALTILAIILLVMLGPELFEDRISSFDSTLFAANGALFYSIYTNLGDFLSSPVAWMYEYYEQYPALAVRRHPPLFGIVEGFVYLFTGISVFGAKLTNLIYCLIFTTASYLTYLQFLKSKNHAFVITIFTISTAAILKSMHTIFLDIPAWGMVFLSFYFYAKYIDQENTKQLFATVIFAILAAYTYQLACFPLLAIVFHFFIYKRNNLLRINTLSCVILAIILITPLIIFNYIMVKEHLEAAVGASSELFSPFIPITDKTSAAYWLYYFKLMYENYPIHFFGFVFWAVFSFWKKPARAEAFFFLCFMSCYLVFSWIPSKAERYALYLLIPVAPLVCLTIFKVVSFIMNKISISVSPIAATTTILLLISSYNLLSFKDTTPYITGMDRAAQYIFAESERPNIFYSGTLDTAFIFYLRQIDQERISKAHRAGVHVQEPDLLDRYLEDNQINTIIVEEQEDQFAERYASFRNEVNRSLEISSNFTLVKQIEVSYDAEFSPSDKTLSIYFKNK